MNKETSKKNKIVKILLIIIILLVIINIGIFAYRELFGYEHKMEKFENDYESLIAECIINSCTDSELTEKSNKLINNSGLNEEDINQIIYDVLYDD